MGADITNLVNFEQKVFKGRNSRVSGAVELVIELL